jgi:hypothetical protein
MKNSQTDRGKFAFILAIVFLCSLALFTVGLRTGKNKTWPYYPIMQSVYAVKSYVNFGRATPTNQLVTPPGDASRKQFTFHNKLIHESGLYAFLLWNDPDKQYAARLYDENGSLMHQWVIEYTALDPDGPLNNSDSPHAFLILKDGSLIVNFDKGDVFARIDTCSDPIWIRNGVFHHSIAQADDGTIWTWRGDNSASAQFQYLVNIDSHTGETLREIGLIEDIIQKPGYNPAPFLVPAGYQFDRLIKDQGTLGDLFHPNDIEPLSNSMAEAFPLFKADDLLISLRNINFVGVIDPDSKSLKWWSHGPWLSQHDPDFTADGHISIYNNNRNRKFSQIVQIDPVTRIATNNLASGAVNFYSASKGKHQYLPQGKVLIIVPNEGRAIVSTKNGELITEFNNISIDHPHLNGHVSDGVWLPPGYFDAQPKCTS